MNLYIRNAPVLALVLVGAVYGWSQEIARPNVAAPASTLTTAVKAAAAPAIQWVTIPGGSFMMGASGPQSDEAPRHRVTVRTFQMAKTLVTNKQYRACYEAGACPPPDATRGIAASDDQPAVNVRWEQARAFSRWVGGRLPSESEWEYAARSGGKDWAYPWGNGMATCDLAVLTDGNERGCGRDASWPVCSKSKGNTKQGLCDMAGNAGEWVQDAYHGSYVGAPADGSAWEGPAGSQRVFRGGAWCSTGPAISDTRRMGRDPNVPYQGLGFRPVR